MMRLPRATCVMLLAVGLAPAALSQQKQSLAEADQAALDYALRHPNATAKRPTSGIQKSTCPPTIVSLTIPKAQTGTGFGEPIVLQVPCNYDPLGPALPLLIAWNGYGLSPASFYTISDIDDEANARGWLAVAVTGLDDQAFGAVSDFYNCQRNVTAAIEYMSANYAVDPDRIYMVGWSMGAAAGASYVARHLDPAGPMIAALVVNAGAFDLIETYWQEPVAFQFFLRKVFSGLNNPPPGVGAPNDVNFTFHYGRTETVWLDFVTGEVREDLSQMRNLVNVPMLHTYSTDDTVSYLPNQNARFANYVASKGATIVSTPMSGFVPAHTWTLLDGITTLDFLQQHTVQRSPASFELTLDRSSTCYWADITQRTTGSFSEITVDATLSPNRLELGDMLNVSHVLLDPPAAHVDVTGDFTLAVDTNDFLPTVVAIENVPEPTYILDGDAVFTGWSYDDPTQTLSVTLLRNGMYELDVRFDDYSAELTGNDVAPSGQAYHLAMKGSHPDQAYTLLIGLADGVFPMSLIDPADPRNLLVNFNPQPLFVNLALDAGGQDQVSLFIPNNPVYDGVKLYFQFVTTPGTTTVVDEISNRVVATIQVGA